MKTYTQAAMLALWRRSLGLDELRNDCTVEVFEGRDVAAALLPMMRRWYLDLLDSAPAGRVPVQTVTPAVQPVANSRAVRVTLPAAVRRVIHVRADTWSVAVAPLAASMAAGALARVSSPYAGPTVRRPLAVDRGDGTIDLYPGAGVASAALAAVIDPGDDIYTLDEALLGTIPTTITQITEL